jgi:serine/threonine protein kinase
VFVGNVGCAGVHGFGIFCFCFQMFVNFVLFVEGGTLTEAVKTSKFRESEVAYVAHEMFAGISFMHENQVVHRDLKLRLFFFLLVSFVT